MEGVVEHSKRFDSCLLPKSRQGDPNVSRQIVTNEARNGKSRVKEVPQK